MRPSGPAAAAALTFHALQTARSNLSALRHTGLGRLSTSGLCSTLSNINSLPTSASTPTAATTTTATWANHLPSHLPFPSRPFSTARGNQDALHPVSLLSRNTPVSGSLHNTSRRLDDKHAPHRIGSLLVSSSVTWHAGLAGVRLFSTAQSRFKQQSGSSNGEDAELNAAGKLSNTSSATDSLVPGLGTTSADQLLHMQQLRMQKERGHTEVDMKRPGKVETSSRTNYHAKEQVRQSGDHDKDASILDSPRKFEIIEQAILEIRRKLTTAIRAADGNTADVVAQKIPKLTRLAEISSGVRGDNKRDLPPVSVIEHIQTALPKLPTVEDPVNTPVIDPLTQTYTKQLTESVATPARYSLLNKAQPEHKPEELFTSDNLLEAFNTLAQKDSPPALDSPSGTASSSASSRYDSVEPHTPDTSTQSLVTSSSSTSAVTDAARAEVQHPLIAASAKKDGLSLVEALALNTASMAVSAGSSHIEEAKELLRVTTARAAGLPATAAKVESSLRYTDQLDSLTLSPDGDELVPDPDVVRTVLVPADLVSSRKDKDPHAHTSVAKISHDFSSVLVAAHTVVNASIRATGFGRVITNETEEERIAESRRGDETFAQDFADALEDGDNSGSLLLPVLRSRYANRTAITDPETRAKLPVMVQRSLRELERVFVEAEKRAPLAPSAYTLMMTTYASLGFPSIAADLFDRMRESDDAVPDTAACNAMLDILAKAGKISAACAFFEEMKNDKSGLVVCDNKTYSTVISALSKIGDRSGALSVFNQMRSSGIEPNVITWSAVIDTVSQAGDFKTGLQLLHEMKVAGVRPNRATYRSMIMAAGRHGQVALATSLIHQMSDEQILPDLTLFAQLIRCLGESASAGESVRILKQLSEGHFGAAYLPNATVYNALLEVLADPHSWGRLSISDRMLEVGIAVYQQALLANVFPHPYTERKESGVLDLRPYRRGAVLFPIHFFLNLLVQDLPVTPVRIPRTDRASLGQFGAAVGSLHALGTKVVEAINKTTTSTDSSGASTDSSHSVPPIRFKKITAPRRGVLIIMSRELRTPWTAAPKPLPYNAGVKLRVRGGEDLDPALLPGQSEPVSMRVYVEQVLKAVRPWIHYHSLPNNNAVLVLSPATLRFWIEEQLRRLDRRVKQQQQALQQQDQQSPLQAAPTQTSESPLVDATRKAGVVDLPDSLSSLPLGHDWETALAHQKRLKKLGAAKERIEEIVEKERTKAAKREARKSKKKQQAEDAAAAATSSAQQDDGQTKGSTAILPPNPTQSSDEAQTAKSKKARKPKAAFFGDESESSPSSVVSRQEASLPIPPVNTIRAGSMPSSPGTSLQNPDAVASTIAGSTTSSQGDETTDTDLSLDDIDAILRRKRIQERRLKQKSLKQLLSRAVAGTQQDFLLEEPQPLAGTQPQREPELLLEELDPSAALTTIKTPKKKKSSKAGSQKSKSK